MRQRLETWAPYLADAFYLSFLFYSCLIGIRAIVCVNASVLFQGHSVVCIGEVPDLWHTENGVKLATSVFAEHQCWSIWSKAHIFSRALGKESKVRVTEFDCDLYSCWNVTDKSIFFLPLVSHQTLGVYVHSSIPSLTPSTFWHADVHWAGVGWSRPVGPYEQASRRKWGK